MTNKQRTRRDFLKTAGTIVGATAGLGFGLSEVDAGNIGCVPIPRPPVAPLADWQKTMIDQIDKDFNDGWSLIADGIFNETVREDTGNDSSKFGPVRLTNAIEIISQFTHRKDVMKQVEDVLVSGLFMKAGDSAWQVLAAASTINNFLVYDPEHEFNTLSANLFQYMQICMHKRHRNITDLFVSPELFDEFTKRYGIKYNNHAEIDSMWMPSSSALVDFTMDANDNWVVCDNEDMRRASIMLHSFNAFGVGQLLQNLLSKPSDEGGFGICLPGQSREFVIGIDRNTDTTGHWAKQISYYAPGNTNKRHSIEFDRVAFTEKSEVRLSVSTNFVVTDATHVLLGAV